MNRVQALIEFDLTGRVLGANENFLALMGYDLSEIQGQHHRIFCAPDYTKTEAYEEFWRFLQTGQFHTGEFKRLTKGPWVVTDLIGVDEKAGRVTFIGTRDDVLAPQVYAFDLKSPDKIERLTDPAFHNSAAMDRKGQTLVVTRSADRQPPQSYLADASGNRLAWIEENRVEGAHPYAPFLASHRRAILQRSPTTSVTMWATAPVWPLTCSKPMP